MSLLELFCSLDDFSKPICQGSRLLVQTFIEDEGKMIEQDIREIHTLLDEEDEGSKPFANSYPSRVKRLSSSR